MQYRFEVLVNGERKCVAGINVEGILTAAATAYICKGDLDLGCALEVCGVESQHGPEHQSVSWFQPAPLRVGDELTVRILDKGDFDSPPIVKEVDER